MRVSSWNELEEMFDDCDINENWQVVSYHRDTKTNEIEELVVAKVHLGCEKEYDELQKDLVQGSPFHQA